MQSVLLNTNKQGIREQDRAPSGSRKLAANKHKRNMFANRVHELKLPQLLYAVLPQRHDGAQARGVSGGHGDPIAACRPSVRR